MKKGLFLAKVYITGSGTVTAYDIDRNEVKLTRNQRNLFTKYDKYTEDDFIHHIIKEFSNPKILAPDFFIAVDDDVVFNLG